MYFLIAGAVLFFAVHLYSAFRTRIPSMDARERVGHARFMGIYSIISLIGFALMIWGYDLARPSPTLFMPPVWGFFVPWVLMLPAFILLMSAYGPRGYIRKFAKHPMLWATILWSLGHLFANAEINSLILFGGFLAFAVIDRFCVSGRPEPVKKTSISGDIFALVTGGALYWATIVYLHPSLIGVSITP